MMTGTVTDQDRESSEPRYLRPKTRHWRNSALLVLMTSLAQMTRRVQPRYSESTFANICNCDHCQSRGTFLISDKDRILPVSAVRWGVTQSVTLCLVSTVWDMCRYNCQLSQQQHDIQYYNINFQVWDVDRAGSWCSDYCPVYAVRRLLRNWLLQGSWISCIIL